MNYTFTPLPMAKPNYESIAPAKVGKGIEGPRKPKLEGGSGGVEKVGKGPWGKNNTIREIAKRGSSGGDHSGWDQNDIGWIGRMYGITPKHLINFEIGQELPELQRKYDRTLKALNIRNKDGSIRQAMWGDTDEGLKVLISDAEKAKKLRATEPDRVRREKTAEENRVEEININRRAQNQQGELMQAQLAHQVKRDSINDQNRWDEKREARIAAQEARIINSENLMANLALEKFRINENNQLRRDEFEYKQRRDQLQRSQDIANAFVNMAVAFTL